MRLQRRLQRYGMLVLGVLLALYGCGRDPQVKKAGYTQKGMAYVAAKKYVEAILEFKTAIQIDPNDAQIYYQLGLAYLKLGMERSDRSRIADMQEAFRALVKSVQLDTTNMDAQLKLGELYLFGRDFTEAEAKAEVVLKHAPDN